jgi:hypothetical protein
MIVDFGFLIWKLLHAPSPPMNRRLILSSPGNRAGSTTVPANTVGLALLDSKTGFQPVREDSASRLSANEATGWKPVGPDRRDACPPANLKVWAVPAVRADRRPRLSLLGSLGSAGILPAVLGILPNTLQPLSRVSAPAQGSRQENCAQQDKCLQSPIRTSNIQHLRRFFHSSF